MGRQVERSERGLRSGLPRPRVEREEQVIANYRVAPLLDLKKLMITSKIKTEK